MVRKVFYIYQNMENGILHFIETPLLQNASLLLLRLLVGQLFMVSGWNDLKDTKARAQSMGLSPRFTKFIGAAELLGGLGVASGFLIQPACIGLILILLGAIQKKVRVWKTGYWGKTGQGWSYDLLIIACLLLLLVNNGGGWIV